MHDCVSQIIFLHFEKNFRDSKFLHLEYDFFELKKFEGSDLLDKISEILLRQSLIFSEFKKSTLLYFFYSKKVILKDPKFRNFEFFSKSKKSSAE